MGRESFSRYILQRLAEEHVAPLLQFAIQTHLDVDVVLPTLQVERGLVEVLRVHADEVDDVDGELWWGGGM